MLTYTVYMYIYVIKFKKKVRKIYDKDLRNKWKCGIKIKQRVIFVNNILLIIGILKGRPQQSRIKRKIVNLFKIAY